ncbi:MAG: 4Fe-4S binding protein, partial [Mariniphaga sp.]|nr:4Fe-4S binding protein [Mariniphaga sp.]
YIVEPLSCEGCGYCARVCPTDAITNENQNVGQWYMSTTKVGSTMIHARLGIGADNSGKLVAKVKNEAKLIAEENHADYILVDGSPGVGCPVVSYLSGANFVVLVTEPSVSGLHDLKRVYMLVKKFNIKAGCMINKADINPQVTKAIEEFLKSENIVHISNLPYDESFTKAMTNGQTIVEYSENTLREMMIHSWNKIKQVLT